MYRFGKKCIDLYGFEKKAIDLRLNT